MKSLFLLATTQINCDIGYMQVRATQYLVGTSTSFYVFGHLCWIDFYILCSEPQSMSSFLICVNISGSSEFIIIENTTLLLQAGSFGSIKQQIYLYLLLRYLSVGYFCLTFIYSVSFAIYLKYKLCTTRQ